MPTIAVEGYGPHLVEISLREGPGAMLDRVEFQDEGGTVAAAVEAEAIEGAGADLPDLPDRIFRIVNAGHSRVAQSTRINHARIPIGYVHHKFGATLAAEETLANQALFYHTDSAEHADWDLRRVSDRAALLMREGEPYAAVVIGGALDLPPQLRAGAAMLWLQADRVVACDTEAGVDLEVDLAARNLGSAVLSLTALEVGGRTAIAAGCRSGMVYLLDGALAELARFPTGSQVNWLSAARTGAGPLVVAALQDGRVLGLRP